MYTPSNPVKMSDLLRDLLNLGGIISKKKITITQITVRDDITQEVRIESFTEFVKLYPLASGYCIEIEEPEIIGIGRNFKVNILAFILRRINGNWRVEIHTEEQEYHEDIRTRIFEELKKRKMELINTGLTLWKIVEMLRASVKA